MKINVLVSTMNQENRDLLPKEMHLKNDYIIINQITKNITIPDNKITKNNKFLSFNERGLSRSRNRALQNSTTDICVVADDDMHYEKDYKKTINDAYITFPDADIIVFYVDNEDDDQRKKPLRAGRLNLIQTMKIASWQITFRRKSLTDKGINFDNCFGTGTEIGMGEENILLFDCVKKGLRVYSYPIKIATLKKDSVSTWFKGYTEKYFLDFGKIYYRMSHYLCLLLIVQFSIRKYALYRDNFGRIHVMRLMLRGVREYIEQKNIYYAGDFISDNGPAIVNKSYEPYLKNYMYACKSNNKLVRVLHFIICLPKTKKIIVSCNSRFHVKIIRLANRIHINTFYLMHGYAKLENKYNRVFDKQNQLRDEEIILSECTKIICVSENFAKFLQKDRPDLKDKIGYVNNGVDSPLGLSKPVKNGKSKSLNIISVGGGVPRKNNLAVCRAIERLSDESITFTVIGRKDVDGDKIASYPFVKYYNNVLHDEVLRIMSKSNLYIQNSSFETFGLAVCEAIDTGCNILISKNVGAVCVIDNMNEDNIIIDTDNIDEISNKIRYLLSKNIHKTICFKDYSLWSDSATRLINVINQKT